MKQAIDIIPQKFSITERGGAPTRYPNVRRQVRRRLEEIDAQMAALAAKKQALLNESDSGDPAIG